MGTKRMKMLDECELGRLKKETCKLHIRSREGKATATAAKKDEGKKRNSNNDKPASQQRYDERRKTK